MGVRGVSERRVRGELVLDDHNHLTAFLANVQPPGRHANCICNRFIIIIIIIIYCISINVVRRPEWYPHRWVRDMRWQWTYSVGEPDENESLLFILFDCE